MTESATKEKKPVGRPKKTTIPIEQTDQFKAAVAAAASQAAANILATLEANQNGQTRPGDASFAEGLALAIASLSNQGVGRAKPVDPSVIAARTAARERMTELIIGARAAGEVPSYELRNKVYLDEVLVDPVFIDPVTKEQRPTRIDWPGVPNEAMIPVNDSAKTIHTEFSDSIGVVQIDKSKHLKPETFGVTAMGLVVHGAGHALRPMQVGNERPGAPQNVGEGLVVHGRGSPTAKQKTINVLGTVASPARVGI